MSPRIHANPQQKGTCVCASSTRGQCWELQSSVLNASSHTEAFITPSLPSRSFGEASKCKAATEGSRLEAVFVKMKQFSPTLCPHPLHKQCWEKWLKTLKWEWRKSLLGILASSPLSVISVFHYLAATSQFCKLEKTDRNANDFCLEMSRVSHGMQWLVAL